MAAAGGGSGPAPELRDSRRHRARTAGSRSSRSAGTGRAPPFGLPEDADGGSSLPRAGGCSGSAHGHAEPGPPEAPRTEPASPDPAHPGRGRPRAAGRRRNAAPGPPPPPWPSVERRAPAGRSSRPAGSQSRRLGRGPRGSASRREPRSGPEHPPRAAGAAPGPAAGPVPVGAGGYRRSVRLSPHSPGAVRSGGRGRRAGGRLRPSIATAAPSGMPGAAAGGGRRSAGSRGDGPTRRQLLGRARPGAAPVRHDGRCSPPTQPPGAATPAAAPPQPPSPGRRTEMAKEQSEPSFIP